MNVVIAFLYDFVIEKIYVTQSNDFVIDLNLVCRLLKILYDLKQTFKVWYDVIRDFLKSLSFESIVFDANVFVFKNKKIYIVVYVNDLLIMNFNMNFINTLKKKLSDRFNMIDLNFAEFYLNIEIVREENSILFRQNIYLKKILKRFDMKNCFVVNFSMKSKLDKILEITKNDQIISFDIMYWYESVIDCLMFAFTKTRSDFSYAFSLLSRWKSNFDFTHVAVLQRIFRYIKKTLHYDIDYELDQNCWHEFSNARWLSRWNRAKTFYWRIRVLFDRKLDFVSIETTEFCYFIHMWNEICCSQWNDEKNQMTSWIIDRIESRWSCEFCFNLSR